MFAKTFVLFTVFAVVLSAKTATFKNVVFRGYRLYEEKFSKTLKSADTLHEYLPESEFDKIEIVDQFVPILRENSLSNLGDLDELVVERNSISKVEPGTFKNVPSLRIISLKGNKIEEIKNNVFSNLNISMLDLSKNQISFIETEAFNNMQDILHINLGENQITQIDNGWFENTPLLTRVSLHHNLIKSIPANAFKNLAGEKSFGNLNLKVNIILDHNKIRTIDVDAFRGIQVIDNLWLDNNLLENFDEATLDKTEITKLTLGNNRINCLSGDYNKLFKAETTDIDSNPFDCKCLKNIETWVEKTKKEVTFYYSDMDCDVKQLRTRISALERNLGIKKYVS